MNCPDCKAPLEKLQAKCVCGRKIPRFLRIGEGLYLDTWTARRVARIGKRWVYLGSLTLRGARHERDKARAAHTEFVAGLRTDPFDRGEPLSKLLADWIGTGCPDRKLRPASQARRQEYARAIERVTKFLGQGLIDATFADRYHAWRIKRVKRGAGHRTVDLELACLSTALHWLARTRRIPSNPLLERPTFSHLSANRHANECQPQDDEELHRLATCFFSSTESAALGWQLLVEALTGCRTSEVLRLRHDARKRPVGADPGHFDDHALYIERSKHGIFPYVPMHPALRDCLTALRAWRDEFHPLSPWYFPGRDSRYPLDKHALTHGLARLSKLWMLGPRTSHGLRAFHVRVLRAQGIDDSEIAKRLGLRTGVALIEQVYGGMEPGWFGCGKLDWLPANSSPAWARWIQTESKIVQISAAL